MNENREKRIKSQILKSECSRELMGGIEGIIKFLQNAKAKYEKENWQDLGIQPDFVYDTDEDGYEYCTHNIRDFDLVGWIEETDEEFKKRLKDEKIADEKKEEVRKQEKINFHIETLNDLGFDVILAEKRKDHNILIDEDMEEIL